MSRKVALPVVVVVLLALAVREISAMRQTYLAGSSYSSSYGTEYGTYYYYQQEGSAEDPSGCLTRDKVSPDRRMLGDFCPSEVKETNLLVNTPGVQLAAFASKLEGVTGLRWWVWVGLALVVFFLIFLAFLGGLIIGRKQVAPAALPSSSGKNSGVQKPSHLRRRPWRQFAFLGILTILGFALGLLFVTFGLRLYTRVRSPP